MNESTNDGFAVVNKETGECKVRFLVNVYDCKADGQADEVPEGLHRLMTAVINDYSYLIM